MIDDDGNDDDDDDDDDCQKKLALETEHIYLQKLRINIRVKRTLQQKLQP